MLAVSVRVVVLGTVKSSGPAAEEGGRGEVRTGSGRVAAGVNSADLKGYVVIIPIFGDDGDAGDGIAGQVVSGGEGLSVISGIAGIGIAALPGIADQVDGDGGNHWGRGAGQRDPLRSRRRR